MGETSQRTRKKAGCLQGSKDPQRLPQSLFSSLARYQNQSLRTARRSAGFVTAVWV